MVPPAIWHWLIVLVIVIALFAGRGSIASIMGDFARSLGGGAPDEKALRTTEEKLNRWLMVVAMSLAVAYGIGYLVIAVRS